MLKGDRFKIMCLCGCGHLEWCQNNHFGGGPREKLKGILNDKQDVMKGEDPGPSHNEGGIQGISVF